MDDASFLSDLVQAGRLLRIDTPLGGDALLLERFAGREMVNGLFEFRAVVRAKRDDVTPQDLVGKTVDWSLDLGAAGRESAQGQRWWNALVTDLVEEPRLRGGLRQYVLTLRPDLWLLSQRADCRIWQNRTSLEVAETLLGEHGLARPEAGGVTRLPAAQEFSVQWNETDLDYLRRRLEEDGLFFWVRHARGAQTVVLADSATAWDKGFDGKAGRVRYSEGSTDRDHFSEWRRRFRFVPGRRAGRDWNFETPGMVPGGETPSLVSLPRNGAYELYEYPARALDASANETASRLRMQATEADHERIEGQSTVRTMAPGAKVTPFDVADPDNGFETGVVLLVEHEAQATSYETGNGEPVYRNSVEALPARVAFTPHRTTRRPRIEGSQIAIVAGPAGEEIHTDQYGRVKLWFPWDRRARKDGSDTKWMRVGQPWAGGQWGSQIIPRIGMEAVVSFQDGDPDKPIVTALVPNPQQQVPYGLPANKTRMVLRSDTHKGEGYNEVSFEDENGQENLFTHAQKDMTARVLNNSSSHVDAHQVSSIGLNKSTDVGGNQQEKIGGSMNLSVGGSPVFEGGGFSLAQLLGTVIAAGGRFMQRNAQRSGSSPQSFGSGLTRLHSVAEAASLPLNAAFNAAGNHRQKAGGELAGAGAVVGDVLSKIMPLSGIMNVVVERFRSDTVGIARTEQIGIHKNTVVGNTQTVSVGKLKKLLVGEDYDVEAKQSIFSRTAKHTLLGREKVRIAGPGGEIVIDKDGITIRTPHLKIKSPRVEFLSGSPNQREALTTDKPFVQDCGGNGKKS